MIICDSSFKKYIKTFPTLYFLDREFSFTFNLDYNDLFIEIDNKIYFLILGKDMEETVWKLGKIFMKKYPFIFDPDKKTISFVHLKKYKDINDDESKNNKNHNVKKYLIVGFIFIGIIIGIIIGYFIGRKYWYKNRKTRANELDENVEYINKDEKSNKIIDEQS